LAQDRRLSVPKKTMRRSPDAEETQARIIHAAMGVLKEHGLTDWTVEEVAKRAECAKGLVNYHFSSKTTLLTIVATQARTARSTRRLLALKHSGADALDRLWATMTEEAHSGGLQLWLALLAYPPTTGSATVSASERQLLTNSAATALNLRPTHPSLTILPATLDGLELELYQGAPEADVRERYDRFWLDLLTTAGAG
jgi:AcrR family transcriptional regulator